MDAKGHFKGVPKGTSKECQRALLLVAIFEA